MKNILHLFLILAFNPLFSQDKVGFNDVYIDNNLIYKVTDDQLFSGFVQKIRKNGHLVYEEEYKNGIILSSKLYFNGKKKLVSDKVVYNQRKPFSYSKEYKFNSKGETIRIVTYNDDSLKILEEEFVNGNLSYSCEFSNGKKHGMMLGYFNGEETLTYKCEYVYGKKHGTEYCLNEKGIEKIKQFHYGKRID